MSAPIATKTEGKLITDEKVKGAIFYYNKTLVVFRRGTNDWDATSRANSMATPFTELVMP